MAFSVAVFLILFEILMFSQCQGCNQTLTQPSGTFSSPGFPVEYEDYTFCSWTIEADPNHIITLSFSDFALEEERNCSYDYLEVYDGSEPEDPLLGQYCGTILPSTIRSSGNMMYIVFSTDQSVTDKGFSAVYQSQDCIKGRYGANCAQECGQGCINSDCNSGTGACIVGCKDGYTGDKCEECRIGRYGPTCQGVCSQECANTDCDRVTGNCLNGCKNGFTGDTCNECIAGRHGSDCSLSCPSNCNTVQCQHDTGYCTGCVDGYYGNLCENRCSQNCEDSVCNQDNGICFSGCIDGYAAPLCTEACKAGFYGPSCSKTCSIHCFINATDFLPCHHETGTCPQGCIKGYTGQRCESEISEDSLDTLAMGIGIGVGGMALVGIIIAVVAVCCYRRRSSPVVTRQESHQYNETKMDDQEEHSYKQMYTSDDTERPNLPTDAPSESVYQNTNEETYQNTTTQSASADDNVYEDVTEMKSMEGRQGDADSTDVNKTTSVSNERSDNGVYVNFGMTE